MFAFVGCRLALFALGVFVTSETNADHRRLKLAMPKTRGTTLSGAAHGSLILANQQSFVDVLYLGAVVCPTFVFVAADGSPVVYSLLGALSRAGSRRPVAAPPTKISLPQIAKDVAAAWRGPVIVFPEGGRTNGSCVLAWNKGTFADVESFDAPIGTGLLSFDYSKSGAYTPHHTVGTTFRHVFWMCMQPFHTLKTVWLPASEVAAAVKGKPAAEQISFLRTILVRMLPGAVEVEVGAAKHVEFMGFWDASQRKGYTQQSRLKKA